MSQAKIQQGILATGIFAMTAVVSYMSVISGGQNLTSTPYYTKSAQADATLSGATDGSGARILDGVVTRVIQKARAHAGTPMDNARYNAYIDAYLTKVSALDDSVRAQYGSDYAFLFQYIYPRVYEMRITSNNLQDIMNRLNTLNNEVIITGTTGTGTTGSGTTGQGLGAIPTNPVVIAPPTQPTNPTTPTTPPTTPTTPTAPTTPTTVTVQTSQFSRVLEYYVCGRAKDGISDIASFPKEKWQEEDRRESNGGDSTLGGFSSRPCSEACYNTNQANVICGTASVKQSTEDSFQEFDSSKLAFDVTKRIVKSGGESVTFYGYFPAGSKCKMEHSTKNSGGSRNPNFAISEQFFVQNGSYVKISGCTDSSMNKTILFSEEAAVAGETSKITMRATYRWDTWKGRIYSIQINGAKNSGYKKCFLKLGNMYYSDNENPFYEVQLGETVNSQKPPKPFIVYADGSIGTINVKGSFGTSIPYLFCGNSLEDIKEVASTGKKLEDSPDR